MTTRWHGGWSRLSGVLKLTVLVAGCSGAPAGQPDAEAAPACAWPSALDRAHASDGQCVAGRAYLSCTAADGSGQACLTDDVTHCPDPSATGQSYPTCQNLCSADEYAVACGGPGPGPWPTPPSGCRVLPSGPGGGSIACCPCPPGAPASSTGGDGAVATGGSTFDCGGTAACNTAFQLCEQVAGGAPPGVGFSACIALPAACVTDRSCTCAVAQLKSRGATSCESTDAGDLTVQISVP